MHNAMQNNQNNILILNRDRQDTPGACQSCAKKSACSAAGICAGTGAPMQRVVRPGKTACAAGEKFQGIYVVRSGFFKSYAIDASGTMQVTGFYLPGDFFGMDGLESGFHKEYVEALDTGSVCRIAVESLGNGATDENRSRTVSPLLMLSLVKLMSRTIGRDHEMFAALGKMSARQRLGSFLLDLATRMAQSGYSATEFRLCMSRTDIANYLCLALETVSRLFTQLQESGVITVNRRNLRILQKQQLVDHEDARDKQIGNGSYRVSSAYACTAA